MAQILGMLAHSSVAGQAWPAGGPDASWLYTYNEASRLAFADRDLDAVMFQREQQQAAVELQRFNNTSPGCGEDITPPPSSLGSTPSPCWNNAMHPIRFHVLPFHQHHSLIQQTHSLCPLPLVIKTETKPLDSDDSDPESVPSPARDSPAPLSNDSEGPGAGSEGPEVPEQAPLPPAREQEERPARDQEERHKIIFQPKLKRCSQVFTHRL